MPRCVSISTTEQKTAKASTPPALIWTTWTTEHRHARRCVSVFAPLCVHIYKGHQSHHPPRIGEYIDKRPAEGVQLSRPPDMNDTDNEGKASTDEKKTDPDTDKYRQHGQPPAALRLYIKHTNGRPLRIENGRKRSLPNMDNHQRRPANIRRYIYMLQRYEKPRTKQNHNAAKRNAPQRGCSVHTARPNMDNVDNMDKRPPR